MIRSKLPLILARFTSLRFFTIRAFMLVFFVLVTVLAFAYCLAEIQALNGTIERLSGDFRNLRQRNASSEAMLNALTHQNQYVINQNLMEEMGNMQRTYKKSESSYEMLLDLKDRNVKITDLDSLYAQSLSFLAERNYASADADLNNLIARIQAQKDKIAAAQSAAQETVPSDNTPPSSGYRRQSVKTDVGTFTLDIISADLNSTRVIIDTASDSDCGNNCPVLPLGTYAARSGAYAAINGAYFCPASYPSCAGKTNSFDTLLMNKNKHYFNSDNNVYSTVPAVIFKDNWARFVSQSLEWGRDTSVDAVIANYPLLVKDNQIVYSGSSDPKLTTKGPRCFIGTKDNMVYIGLIYGADANDEAHTVHALGIANALNLDEGGSTALWYSGSYIAGPGRDIPDAVLFVKR